MGLSLVSAEGAAAQSAVNKAAPGAARGGRNAELQSKGRHSDNAFRSTSDATEYVFHLTPCYGTFPGTPSFVRACAGTRHVRIAAESSIQGAAASG